MKKKNTIKISIIQDAINHNETDLKNPKSQSLTETLSSGKQFQNIKNHQI